MRWPFLRTTNKANDDSFTVSPRSRVKRTAGCLQDFLAFIHKHEQVLAG
jgi:hypothetical protein